EPPCKTNIHNPTDFIARSVNRLQIPLIQQGECIMDTSRRTENLRGVMREKNIDLSIIVDFQNQFYFSGLKAITYTRPMILAIDSTKMSLIVPSLEENHAKTATPADHLLVYHETPLGHDQNMSYIDLFKRCIAT